MGSILIISSDDTWIPALKTGLADRSEAEGLTVWVSPPGDGVLAALRHRPVDLIVADSEADRQATQAWAESLRNSRPDTPILLVARPGVAIDAEPAAGLRQMGRPQTPDALFDELCDLQRKERKTFLSGTSVGHFVQLLASDKKTCSVAVHAPGKTGVLFFEKGKLADAVCGEETGSRAALTIFGLSEEPDIEVRRLYLLPDKAIAESLSALVMQAARDRDSHHEVEAGAAKAVADRGTGEEELMFLPNELASRLENAKGVRSMAVVRRDGTVLAQSKGGRRFAAFFAYTALVAERIRALMGWQGPRRLNGSFASGWKIVGFGGEEMVAGLLVDPSAVTDETASDLSAALREITLH